MLFGLSNEAEEEKYRELQALRHKNGSLNSPSMKQLAVGSLEGRGVLKFEIAESNQRLM